MKYTILTLLIISFIPSFFRAQNVGIGTTTPQSQLAVGTTSQFRVNSSGNLVRINNIPYSFPTVQGTDQYLKNDGSGNLTWEPAARPVMRVFAVSAFGSSDYLIDNPGDYSSGINNDPTLVLHRGFTYQFSNSSGHPFTISNAPNSGSFNVGVNNNGAGVGIISFTVPMDAPNPLYYYCAAHPLSMFGTLQIQ